MLQRIMPLFKDLILLRLFNTKIIPHPESKIFPETNQFQIRQLNLRHKISHIGEVCCFWKEI